MTLPGPEKGHLELPNWLVERLARLHLTSTQWQILWAVWRKTLCWQVGGRWKNRSYPISKLDLATETGVGVSQVKRELRELVAMKIILREKIAGGREHKAVTAFNLDPSTWEIKGGEIDPLYEKKGGEIDPLSAQKCPPFVTDMTPFSDEYDPLSVPDSGTGKKHLNKHPKKTSKETVFELWNSLNLIKHAELTDERSHAIKAALEGHTVEELCQAIIDYAEVLHAKGRFSELHWSLEDFLSQGLDKFVASKPSLDPMLAEISKLYEENIGQLTPRLAEEFIEFCSEFDGPLPWVREAFEEALSRKKRNWRYIRKILENWQEGGKPDAKVTRQPQKRRRPITYIKGAGEGGEREG